MKPSSHGIEIQSHHYVRIVENGNLPHPEELISFGDFFDFPQNGFLGFFSGRNQSMHRDAKGFRFRTDRQVGGLEDMAESGGQKKTAVL